MSGTYMLHASRARFDQHELDTTCLLCCINESVGHFLLRCESLTKVWQFVLIKIHQSLQNSMDLGYFNRKDTLFTAIMPSN